MGCRPSRRAVACVRVAGEPWGSGRSGRPRSINGDSAVRLRHRSSRRSRDEGSRDEGVCGANPRDRYSAPPVDRQFPPHSCTSAVYEHGCCGTSRITLRLSKNGSTLEIEKCDFEHGVKSCQLCGTAGAKSMVQDYSDIPLRAQSAPNLAMTIHDNRTGLPKTSNPPHFAKRSNKHIVHSESHPPPLPVRHMERLSAASNDNMISPRGSVCTATRIDVDVDVESVAHSSQPSSSNSQFRNDIVTQHVNQTRQVSFERAETRAKLEKFHFPQQSEYPENLLSDAQIHSENTDTYSCPYSPSSEDLSRLLRDADELLINDYSVGPETVDLTKFDPTNPGLHEEDSDIDYVGRLNINFSRNSVDELTVLEPSGNASSTDSIVGCNTQTDNAQSPVHDSDDSLFTMGASEGTACHTEDRPHMHGATDYRIRMLGAQKQMITSLADKEAAAEYYINNAVTQISDGQTILASCDGPVSKEDNNDVDECSDNEVVEVDVYGTTIINGGEGVPLTPVHFTDVPVADHSTDKVSKLGLCHDKLMDHSLQGTGENSTHHLTQRGMPPAFFYADLQNDNIEDNARVLDNSNPELDSIC